MRSRKSSHTGHRGGRHGHQDFDENRGGTDDTGGRGRHRRGGRGRHRVIDSGELRLLLMTLLQETPRHGYELIQEIDGMTGGAYAPSPGMVYPTLTLLQEIDQISEVPSDGPRKAFTLTDQGTAELTAKAEDVTALVARLSDLKETHERVDGGPVRRASDNLRRVIRNRLVGDDVDKELLHTVAGLLDDAAQKIERL